MPFGHLRYSDYVSRPPRAPMHMLTGTHSDVLLALPQSLALSLDVFVDAVADALGVGLALEPGYALMFGFGCRGAEELGKGVPLGVGTVYRRRPGSGEHGGLAEEDGGLDGGKDGCGCTC